MAKRRQTPLRTSSQDVAATKRAPSTPQTESPAFRLAFADDDFLTSEETRGIRFQLEYMKPETRMREAGINSTVVLFGGARIPEPGKPAWAAKNETQKTNLELASRYYDEARRFAQLVSITSKASGYKDYIVTTGGGPGVMEAGNRGAADVGAPSSGSISCCHTSRRPMPMSRLNSASISIISPPARFTSCCAPRRWQSSLAASARSTSSSKP